MTFIGLKRLNQLRADAVVFKIDAAPTKDALDKRRAELSDSLRASNRTSWYVLSVLPLALSAVAAGIAFAALLREPVDDVFGGLMFIAMLLLIGASVALDILRRHEAAEKALSAELAGLVAVEPPECPALLGACAAGPESERYRLQVVSLQREFVRAEHTMLFHWARGATGRAAKLALYRDADSEHRQQTPQ